MPPLNVYEFTRIGKDDFFIKIYAYSEKKALQKLTEMVKSISDFKHS